MCVAGEAVCDVIVYAAHVLAVNHEHGVNNKVCKEMCKVEVAMVLHLVEGRVK